MHVLEDTMTTNSPGAAVWTLERTTTAVVPKSFVLPLGPSLERRRLQLYLGLMLADALGIAVASFAVASMLERGIMASMVLLFIPIYWTSALYMRVYSVRALTSLRFAQLHTVYALLASLVALSFIAYLTHSPLEMSRLSMGFSFAAAAVLLASIRSVMRHYVVRRVGPTAENVLIIDDGGGPARIAGAWSVVAREHNLRPDCSDPHMLDRLGLFMTNMDRVLVSCPPERRAAWAMIFKGSNISGEIVDQDVLNLGAIGARRCDAFGTLIVSAGPLSIKARAIKRALDLTLAGSAIAFLMPLLLTVALLIRLEDGGSVFFRQQRQGRNNRLFVIYKFRSMRVPQLDADGARSTQRDDDRITRVGRFIRRTSIDELPQLINVLRGDMSLVGPRPHAIGSTAENKKFWEIDPRYLLRHSLKPGLTGLAQVRGHRGATDSESDLHNRLQSDLEYLDGWTFWRDIRILFATFKVLVHHRAF